MFSDAHLTRRLVDDLRDPTGARINQHGSVIYNGVAVGIAETDTGRERGKACARWHGLTHCHRFSNLDRGAPLRGHVRTYPSRLLGTKNPACGCPGDPADSSPDWTTHHRADDSTARSPGREPCSRVRLASPKGKSQKTKSQRRLENMIIPGASFRLTWSQGLDPVLEYRHHHSRVARGVCLSESAWGALPASARPSRPS